MTTITTPRHDLELLVQGDTGAITATNDQLTAIDALLGASVLDKDLTTPPGSPSDGDCYIPAATATGAWATFENYILLYFSGWKAYQPTRGTLCWVYDESRYYFFDGAAWQPTTCVGATDAVNAETGLTASTTQTQGQAALSAAKQHHVVATCANASDVVTMPTAAIGTEHVVANLGANTLQVFPPSGSSFDGGATDASTTVAAGKLRRFVPVSATRWLTYTN